MEGYELVQHDAFDYMRTALMALRAEGCRRMKVALHRSVSEADDDARAGAVLAFERRMRGEGGGRRNGSAVPLRVGGDETALRFRYGWVTRRRRKRRGYCMSRVAGSVKVTCWPRVPGLVAMTDQVARSLLARTS